MSSNNLKLLKRVDFENINLKYRGVRYGDEIRLSNKLYYENLRIIIDDLIDKEMNITLCYENMMRRKENNKKYNDFIDSLRKKREEKERLENLEIIDL